MLDDKDHGFKTSPFGIVNGIIDNKLSVSSHGVELLQVRRSGSPCLPP